MFEFLEAPVGAWFADTDPPPLLPEARASEEVGGNHGCRVRTDREIPYSRMLKVVSMSRAANMAARSGYK
jgi:hypothetical protein